MITARSPYQVYKATDVNGTVANFNSLPSEELLPYKILSSEETLLASLFVVEGNEEQRERYAVSALHAARVYISHLISYIPLSARSQTAKKVQINIDAVVRTVMLFAANAELLQSVKKMVLTNASGEQVSLKDLSDLEGALNAMEKVYRQKAKGAGEKVDMLRKVAPEPVIVSSSAAKSQGTTPLTAGEDSGNAASNSTGCSRQRRRRSESTDGPAGHADLHSDAAALKVAKIEGGTDNAPLAAVYATKVSGGPKSVRTGLRGGLVWGRLRGLTNNEKKVAAMLQAMIQVLGHIFATKFNDLVPIFDMLDERLRAVQAIIDAERAQYKAKEDKRIPEPFHEVTLDAVQLALQHSSETFRNDEECRYELDEDLLHPIAHACLRVINHIEGFSTEPFKGPTPEELLKKQQLRDAARAKREEAKRRILEKAEAKAELERKKEEERQLMRRRLGDGSDEHEKDLEEDTTLVTPSTLGYVAYTAELPLGTPELFEKALYVWSMLSSVPRALNLSQMHFATFVKGIECVDQDANGLMEEVTKCLLDVSMESVRLRSPGTPRIVTRGKNWFDALVEFVGVASGNKKKRRQQQRRVSSTEDEEEIDSDSDSDASSSTSSSSSSSFSSKETDAKTSAEEEDTPPEKPAAAMATRGEGAAEAAAEEEVDTDPFSLELKATMDKIAGLRSLASWGNVDAIDRLNLLQFCVLEALGSDEVRNEADRVQKDREEEALNAEKKLREIREEAEKELKALLRTLPSVASTAARKKKTQNSTQKAEPVTKEDNQHTNNAEDEKKGIDEAEGDSETATGKDVRETAQRNFEAEREAILQEVDRKREEVYARLLGVQDGKDDGAIVEPLGMDRYRRLYWRFPMERVVYVQSVPNLTAVTFPVLAEPPELKQRRASSRSLLLDDEEEISMLGGRRRGGRGATAAGDAARAKDDKGVGQTRWGVIPHEYLSTFVQTLDRRGEREAPLRHALETLEPYLTALEEPREGRETRARAHMFGYMNLLKVDFTS
ncbi:nucleoplasmin-like protein (NLP), putative [Leishmania donovani]|uniref:Nucleoplasmin-like protein (NLP), putative n=1 Tax=Leishmania donovani TaxID=5661 RepID=A0A3S7XAG3_LEIDO|nr:nucleoplasmin-like protein (NLP), putative [Leishmania donovani]